VNRKQHRRNFSLGGTVGVERRLCPEFAANDFKVVIGGMGKCTFAVIAEHPYAGTRRKSRAAEMEY
jgi:hypothetical protein